MDRRVEQLQEEFKYYVGTARAAVEANGICVYCREDLLASRLGYSSMEREHLIPKEAHPELEWEALNEVLSCRSCNSLKGKYNPLQDDESALEMLRFRRTDLIERVRGYMKEPIETREREWIRVWEIIRNAEQ